MNYKNIKSFRKWFKEVERRYHDDVRDSDFMGHTSPDRSKFGFFDIFHGAKENITDFLRKEVEMAEDTQAIYEFVQNAADCGATQFYLFYNSTYLLVINNGEVFSQKGICSILNIGQSEGKTDCDKIGRFGIGFKLVHRLVGEASGLKELTNAPYAGPVLFSWSNITQFNDFLNGRVTGASNDFQSEKDAWLFKILLTNFPVAPNEQVLDLDYKPFVPFTDNELKEYIGFLNQNKSTIDLDAMQQGSMFFVRLGNGKAEMLTKNNPDLHKGIQYAMHFLKDLSKIYLNEKIPVERFPNLNTDTTFTIPTSKFDKILAEEKRSDNCPIKITLGYLPYTESEQLVRSAPNFYKYFPIGDEINGLSFIIHSNIFNIRSERRGLHDSIINKAIFTLFVEYLTAKLDKYITENPEAFIQIYANLLLSQKPDKGNNKWQATDLYEPLLAYLKSKIPTNHFDTIQTTLPRTAQIQTVKIKATKLPLNPSNFGIANIQWFYWDNSEIRIRSNAKRKLNLEVWSLRNLLQNGTIDNINQYIQQLSADNYALLLTELRSIEETTWKQNNLWTKFCSVNFLQLSNANKTLYAIQTVANAPNCVVLSTKFTNDQQQQALSLVLQKIDFITTLMLVSLDTAFDKLIHESVRHLSNAKKLFDHLHNYIAKQAHKLSVTEKKLLFDTLRVVDGITESTLADLCLFANQAGEITPLKNLLPSNLNTPTWLNVHKINVAEHQVFSQTNPSVLAQIMIKGNEVYKKLIKNNWNEITKRLPNDFQPEQFYEQIVSYFNKSKDDSSPIASLNIVCTNNKTFVNKNTQAFFSSQLAKVSDYNLLSNVIAQLISLATPHKSIINYLTSPPFNVSESKVSQRSINQSQLFDAEDLKALINFMKTNSEDFWQHYYLQQIADNKIQVHEKTANVVFYYTTNAPLLQFIANHSASLRKKFVLLPNGFTTYIAHNRHVFQQENLETLLLENIAINQHQEELISVLNYTNAQTKLLLAINNITVDTNQLTQYTTDHFVYQVLALAIKHTNNEAVVSHIRKQIILTTGTITVTLADVPSTDTTVQLYTNTESYSLDLAKILPVSYQNNAILAIFVAHFVKLKLDKQAFEQLLGKEKEKAIDETANIYNLLKKELSNQAHILTLQNAEQLAFVLLANISDKLPLSPFCVETLGGLVKLQSNSFYVKTFSFIGVTATLSGAYNGLDKKLKINRHNSIFKTSEATVLLEPYFANNTFNAPLIAIDTETQQLDLLTFLYQKWANSPDVQNLLPQLYWAAGGAFDTEKYLSFNPYCCVDNDAAFDATEQLPEYIANWRNKDAAQNKFLYQLGVHPPNGVLHQLRNYFNNKNINPTELQTAFQQKRINQQLIANTLLYWQQQNVLVNTTEALTLIGYLYGCLPINEYLGVVPMLYIQRITKEDAAFEYVFKDNCATDFLFDKQITEHLHQEGIYLAELLPIIKEQENSELLNQDAYPTNWQPLRSRKINITPATVNYAQLLADSTGEWINDGYKNWCERLKNKYRVYCYKGQIPAYLYLITDENNGGYSIKTRLLGDMVIDETTGNIFVNEAALPNFKDLLNSFVNKGITFDDYVKYLEAMTTKTPPPPNTPNNTDSKGYEENEEGNEIVPPRSGLSKAEQKVISDEAKQLALEQLEAQGFDVSQCHFEHAYLRGVKDANGQAINIVVKSTKWGNLFIHPTEWVELAQPNALLLIINSQNQVLNTTFDDLMSTSAHFHIQFDTDTFSRQGIINFAQLFRYTRNVKFIIEAPNFNYSNFYKTFGLNQAREGEVNQQEDDFLLN